MLDLAEPRMDVGPAQPGSCFAEAATTRRSQKGHDVDNSVNVGITLDQVSKRFTGSDGETVAVSDLSIQIPAGQLVAFVGPSGCGKTTTLKMINRLIEPSSGRILLGEDDVTRVNPVQLRRRIGYVIQNVGLFPPQTVEDKV